MRKKLKIFLGYLPNPNCKVFFIPISTNKQARRLIFVCDFNLTQKNVEKIFEGRLTGPYLKVFFKAISINKQGKRLIFCMKFPFYLTRRIVEKS